MSLKVGAFAIAACLAAVSVGADYVVAPDGKPDAAGTKEAPWDITSALEGKHALKPGDTLWLRGGAYRTANRTPGGQGFLVKLAGEKDKPIQIRACRRERVTLDGGLSIVAPSANLWVWDLEILVSENLAQERIAKETGSHPQDLNRPWGGLNVLSGADHKFTNLVIHDNAQGLSYWSGAPGGEVYGCLIFDNGWKAADRGHGHAIYTQNKDGLRVLADNMMTGGFGYTMHAYGSKRADVDHFLIEGNIAYNAGHFLVGGGKPSHDIRVLKNTLYGISMQIGYNAPENEDCEVRDNLIVNGGLSINKYKKAVNEGNLIVPKNGPRPKGVLAILRPNRYEPGRANLAVFNWDQATEAQVDAAAWLKDGETVRLVDPKDFFGKPVAEAVCKGGKITVPMKGEFAAFVALKQGE